MLRLVPKCYMNILEIILYVSLISGMCSMTAFSYYGNKIRSEFEDPSYREQKYVHLISDFFLQRKKCKCKYSCIYCQV